MATTTGTASPRSIAAQHRDGDGTTKRPSRAAQRAADRAELTELFADAAELARFTMGTAHYANGNRSK